MPYKKLWIALGIVMLVSFAVLGEMVNNKVISKAPPIPAKVVTADGQLLFTGETIRDGQNVWQSTGGQEIGTIWGHGAYVAPDWSADYLHRQSVLASSTVGRINRASPTSRRCQQNLARGAARPFDSSEMPKYIRRGKRHDCSRQRASQSLSRACSLLRCDHGNGRSEYAIPAGALKDATKQRQMATFFRWTAWVASTKPSRRERQLHAELAT